MLAVIQPFYTTLCNDLGEGWLIDLVPRRATVARFRRIAAHCASLLCKRLGPRLEAMSRGRQHSSGLTMLLPQR